MNANRINGIKEVVKMARLNEKDFYEARKLVEMIAALPESEKRQAIIYVSALADRSMIQKDTFNKRGEGRE